MAGDSQSFDRYSRFLQSLSKSICVLGANNTEQNDDLFTRSVRNNKLNRIENVILSEDLSKDSTALEIAAKNGHWKIVEWLLKNRKLLESSGRTALSQAIYKGHSDIAVSLIHAGFSHGRNTYGETLLFVAASGNNVRMTEYLIMLGCDMHAMTRMWTPLHVATYRNYRHVVMMLLKHGSDPDIRNKDGHTALHLAILQRSPSIVNCLLQAGCRVDVDGPDRNTTSWGHHQLDEYPLVIRELLTKALHEPKPLLQLCRWSLRQRMGQHVKLKLDVLAASRQIPQRIHDFLMMEDLFPNEALMNLTHH